VGEHGLLAERFLRSSPLVGEWFPEVPVGFRSVEAARYPTIDLVCALGSRNAFHPAIPLRYWMEGRVSLKGRRVWLIEVEPSLSSTTLGLPVGQLLTYRALFRRDHPGAAVVGLGVVCEEGNALVELACEELGINVWKLPLQPRP
jgi:hypothetical protein